MPPFRDYHWTYPLKVIGVAISYALLIKIVLTYLTADGNISPVWLPSGLGLAVLMIGGRKYLPGIFIGAVSMYLMMGRSLPVTLFIALSNCLEPLSSVWLLTRVRKFDDSLRRPEDYLWLIFVGIVVTALASTIGVVTLLGAGILAPDELAIGWLNWWRGDLFGIVLLTPALLIWREWPVEWFTLSLKGLEAMAFILSAVLTSLVAFHGWTSSSVSGVPLGYLMFLFISWAALRFGRHGVTLILLISAIQGILGTFNGVGFFANDLNSGLANFWLYMMSMTVVGIILSTTILQHRRDLEALRESEALWSFALEGGGDCVWDWNLTCNEVKLSKGGKDMFGFADDEIGNDMKEWTARVHPEDVTGMLAQVSEFFRSRSDRFIAEYRVRCKDNSWKWILTRGMVAHRDTDGTVRRMIGTHTDLTERKQAEDTILRQANYDSLTLLPNRRLFRDRLGQAIRLAKRDNSRMALMLIDLDNFKEINDTMGHDTGDNLLVDTAQRIHGSIRETDTVARMGGDEFVVILTNIVDAGSIDRIAQNINDRLSEPFLLRDEKAFVSASIGITLYPDDSTDMEDLLKHSDQAMYVAKNLGGNRYSYFTPGLQEQAQKRMRLIKDLRNALSEKQFQVYYQPIVSLPTGKIHKAEALLRWIHPTRGMVGPSEFIPLAEVTGLIVEIGDWVLQQAMMQAQRIQSFYQQEFQISVNKSPVQFRVENSFKTVDMMEEMERHGLKASSLVVEITEGVLLDDDGNIQEKLLALRDAGIQVAIDDFGTGYSSLAYLKKFDIDYLKIDQAFVSNLDYQSNDMALCEAIVVMAHRLGLKVIAEGVETEQQRELLLQSGCDYAQGFLFSKAISGQELEDLLHNSKR